MRAGELQAKFLKPLQDRVDDGGSIDLCLVIGSHQLLDLSELFPPLRVSLQLDAGEAAASNHLLGDDPYMLPIWLSQEA